MAKAVTVYTTPSCVQCEATKKLLTSNMIAFEVVDLSAPENQDKLAGFKAQGLMQAPIVEAGGEVWTGFQPGKIIALAGQN